MVPSMLFALLTFVPLIIVMTACQTASPPNKSTTPSTQTTYAFEHRPRQNTPILETSCERIEQDKNRIIFVGKAELRRDQLVNFLADYISIEFDENGMNGVVEMRGNVSMTAPAALNIRSEGAISSDFGIYIDFVRNVSISGRGYRYNIDWVRYYFPQGILQFKWDDIPIRGEIEHRLHQITDKSGSRFGRIH